MAVIVSAFYDMAYAYKSPRIIENNYQKTISNRLDEYKSEGCEKCDYRQVCLKNIPFMGFHEGTVVLNRETFLSDIRIEQNCEFTFVDTMHVRNFIDVFNETNTCCVYPEEMVIYGFVENVQAIGYTHPLVQDCRREYFREIGLDTSNILIPGYIQDTDTLSTSIPLNESSFVLSGIYREQIGSDGNVEKKIKIGECYTYDDYTAMVMYIFTAVVVGLFHGCGSLSCSIMMTEDFTNNHKDVLIRDDDSCGVACGKAIIQTFFFLACMIYTGSGIFYLIVISIYSYSVIVRNCKCRYSVKCCVAGNDGTCTVMVFTDKQVTPQLPTSASGPAIAV